LTYAANILNDDENSNFLAVLEPRSLLDSTGWTLHSGAAFRQSFTIGPIINGAPGTVTQDTTILDSKQNIADVISNAGTYFWDVSDNTLYVQMSDSSNPNTKTVVAIYELYLATIDIYFSRVPTSPITSAIAEVFYEGIISRTPRFKQSAGNNLFGIVPSQTSKLELTNSNKFLQNDIFASSFNLANIRMYHILGEAITANAKLFLTGIMGSITNTDTSVSINVSNPQSIFNKFFRNSDIHPDIAGFTTTNFFPGLIGTSPVDPVHIGKPLRQVHGVVDGFVPVNLAYNNGEDPLNLFTNDQWAVLSSDTVGSGAIFNGTTDRTGSIKQVVAAAPASTTTKTQLVSADGIRIGDGVFFVSSADAAIVTEVDKTGTPHFIDHTATSIPATIGSDVKRHFVSRVDIIHKGVKHTAIFGRDYDHFESTTLRMFGFKFKNITFSSPTIPSWPAGDGFNVEDIVFCRIYGLRKATGTNFTLSSNSDETASMTNGISILERWLSKGLGFAPALIGSSFTTLAASITDELGFAFPPLSTGGFPIYRTIINKLLQTLLLKLYVDDDGIWQIAQTGPLGTVDKTLDDEEIVINSFNYKFDYNNIISDVSVNFNFREVSERGTQIVDASTQTVQSTSDTARVGFALGDRRGKLKINTRNRFLDTNIDDVTKIERTKLPGFVFDEDTERTRNFSTNTIDKGFGNTTIELDDQKGIEDNSGSF